MSRGRFLIAIAAVFTVMLAGSATAFGGDFFSKKATDQGYGGVGVTTTQTPAVQQSGGGSGPGPSGVAGATHNTGSAPLSASRQTGTLPFTGAQLGVFLALGLALLVGGLLLHRGAGRSRTRP